MYRSPSRNTILIIHLVILLHVKPILYQPPIRLPVTRSLLHINDARSFYAANPRGCFAQAVELPAGLFPNMAAGNGAVFVSVEVYRSVIEHAVRMEHLRKLALELAGITHVQLVRYYALGFCDGPPIKGCLEASTAPGICLLMEPWHFAGQPGISLHDLCRSRRIATNQIITYALQLLDAIDYLHNRDHPFVIAVLRSPLIIVSPDRRSLKIADWLNPCNYNEIISVYSFGESHYRFMHPNVFAYWAYSFKLAEGSIVGPISPIVDLWSLGCVVLDMYTQGNLRHVTRDGIMLNERLARPKFLKELLSGGHPLIPEDAPEIIRRLCKKCFERNPKLQLTANQLRDFIERGQAGSPSPIRAVRQSASGRSYLAYSTSYGVERELCFDWHSMVGNGSYGAVYAVNVDSTEDARIRECERENAQNLLALKVLHSADILVEKRTALLQLDHTSVVQYLAIGRIPIGPGGMPFRKPQTAVLMQFCDGGTLNELCRTKKLVEPELLKFLRQIASAISYLHNLALPIFHGDIKGENIFLNSSQTSCKLGDMDNFHLLEEGKTNRGGIKFKEGTLFHMSPEMLRYAVGASAEAVEDEQEGISTGIGRASDVWSVGCVGLEMIGAGEITFRGADGAVLSLYSNKPEQLLSHVTRGASPDQSLAQSDLRPQLFAVLTQCLTRDATQRPTAAELFMSLDELARTTDANQGMAD